MGKEAGSTINSNEPDSRVVKVITSGLASDLGKKIGGIGLKTAMPPIQLT
jgi:hypothetical protein